MRILAFTMSFWHDEQLAMELSSGLFGLPATQERVMRLLKPVEWVLVSGTYSNPAFNPCPGTRLIQGGAAYDRPYDVIWWNYSGCAFTAMYAHALDRDDWDLLVEFDNDMLVGAVDFNALLTEFLQRPEEFLSPDWHGRPGGSFCAMKRPAVARFLHQRRRANLIERESPEQPQPILIEDEQGIIFKGRWWNPWPELPSLRQDFGQNADAQALNEQALQWPFVRLPHPDLVELYLQQQSPQAVPVAC